MNLYENFSIWATKKYLKWELKVDFHKVASELLYLPSFRKKITDFWVLVRVRVHLETLIK